MGFTLRTSTLSLDPKTLDKVPTLNWNVFVTILSFFVSSPSRRGIRTHYLTIIQTTALHQLTRGGLFMIQKRLAF